MRTAAIRSRDAFVFGSRVAFKVDGGGKIL